MYMIYIEHVTYCLFLILYISHLIEIILNYFYIYFKWWHQYTIVREEGRYGPFQPPIKQMKKERKFTHKLIQPYAVLSIVFVPEKERKEKEKEIGVHNQENAKCTKAPLPMIFPNTNARKKQFTLPFSFEILRAYESVYWS